MITVEKLKAFGANTEEALTRCFGNEALYLKLVATIPAEAKFETLRQAIASNNLDAAFEAAHALKGVLGNLSLTPLYTPMVELTEHLRARETMNYAPLLDQILAKKAELAAL